MNTNHRTARFSPSNRWLLVILMLALLLRLIYALAQDHVTVLQSSGGDVTWYLTNGYELVTGKSHAPLPTAPLYLVFIGVVQVLLSRGAAAIIAIRIIQAGLGTVTCYLGFRLTRTLTATHWAGMLTAVVLAVSPVFIIEPAQLLTETLYICLVTCGLWLYIEFVVRAEQPDKRHLALVGLILGLATLTRAVLLLFPLGLVLHLILLRGCRQGLKQASLMLTVYVLIVSTWTVYNLARWNRLVIGGDGFAAFVYMGARGWEGPSDLDEALQEDVPEMAEGEINSPDKQGEFATAASRRIQEDPLGYARRRIGELLEAYTQPHGTTVFPGESLKDLTQHWITEDRSWDGLRRLVTGDAFWPKLGLYTFHFVGLISGLIGIWVTRHRWQVALPLSGFILYTTLIHLVLMVTPRYIFPTEVFWWVFASAALCLWWKKRQPISAHAQAERLASSPETAV